MKLSVFFTGSDQNQSFLQGDLILKFGRTPPPKTSHPWNTSQARYLPELPGGRSKPPPGTFIQYIQWNLLIERKLDLAYCVRHKGGGGQGVPHSQFPPPFPQLPSPFSPTSLPLLPHFPPPIRFFPPPDKMLFLFKN